MWPNTTAEKVDAATPEDKTDSQQALEAILAKLNEMKYVMVGMFVLIVVPSLIFGGLPNAIQWVGSLLGAGKMWVIITEGLQARSISAPFTYSEIIIAGVLFTIGTRILNIARIIYGWCYLAGVFTLKTLSRGKDIATTIDSQI